MFRLIKLALYGLVAYGVYDIVQELINDSQVDKNRRNSNAGGNRQAARQPQRQLGTVERTSDGHGSSMSHRVGRGVRV